MEKLKQIFTEYIKENITDLEVDISNKNSYHFRYILNGIKEMDSFDRKYFHKITNTKEIIP